VNCNFQESFTHLMRKQSKSSEEGNQNATRKLKGQRKLKIKSRLMETSLSK